MFSLFVCHKRSVNISVFGSITGALSFEHEKRLVNKVCKVILLSRQIKAFLRTTLFTRPPSCCNPPMIHCCRHQTQWVSSLPPFPGINLSVNHTKIKCRSLHVNHTAEAAGLTCMELFCMHVCVLLVRLSKCCERQRLHTHCNLLQSHICFV